MDRTELLNDQEEAMRQILEGHQVGLWTALPGIVKAVDFSKMTLEVQPTIQAIIVDAQGVEQSVTLPVLVDVPVIFPSAGGFSVTFPVAVNDEVLVVFASRCIDAWWQSGGVQQAMEARMHDLSDGFAILGPKSLPHVLGSISQTDMEIRKNDGSVYIAVQASGKVKIVASEVDITGNLKVTGTIQSTGEVTGNNIPLSTHHHTGVTTGSGTTGGPIP